ncbi:MAG: hypothetical protein GYB65_20100, partial [Chloroflexi bacterium]|nr:hypothetical protein [Chloroflexota bacterium]
TLRKAAWGPVPRGEDAHILLWWSTESPLLADYTVSVRLLDADGLPLFAPEGGLLAQNDEVPAEGERPTTTWQPGEIIFDFHPLAIPETLSPGTYQVGVMLYAWTPETGADPLPTADGAEWLVAGTLEVE